MIINYNKDGWGIVTQRAHGLLAASIAYRLAHKFRNDRWIEFIIAVADHDDALVELDREDLLTEQGGPVDFKMRGMEYEHCISTMNNAWLKSTYIGILCSMHLDFLCNSNTSDPRIKHFLKEQEAQRVKWLKELNLSEEQAGRDYSVMEWCDALSLLICQQQVQPEGRVVEIGVGPGDDVYLLKQTENNSLTVEPWPFEEDDFELSLESRTIDQLTFASAKLFKKKLQDTNPIITKWRFQRVK